MSRETAVKALCLQIRRLVEQKSELSAKNERINVAKQEIIALPMSRISPKISAKATKKLRYHIE